MGVSLRHLIDKLSESYVYTSVASHLGKPKLCNICTNISQPVNDSPKLSGGGERRVRGNKEGRLDLRSHFSFFLLATSAAPEWNVFACRIAAVRQIEILPSPSQNAEKNEHGEGREEWVHSFRDNNRSHKR